jgi:hypothetical protein
MAKKRSKPSSSKRKPPSSKTGVPSKKKNASGSKTLFAKSPVKKSSKKKPSGAGAKPTPKKIASKKAQKKKPQSGRTTAKKTAAKKGMKGSVASKSKRTATSKLTTKAKSPAARKKATPKKKSTAAKRSKSIAKGTKKPAAAKKTALKAKTSKKAPIKKAGLKKRRAAKKKKAPVKPPFAAYKGIRPYLFTSYAHKNMSEAFSIIKRLNKTRYRIWYDEGIEPGNEWPEVVGTAIVNCTQFLVFMSPHAADSRNVRNEINLAFNEHKEILVVFLQPTNLTEGMRLQIGTVQFINKYALTDQEFFDKINKVLNNSLKN